MIGYVTSTFACWIYFLNLVYFEYTVQKKARDYTSTQVYKYLFKHCSAPVLHVLFVSYI